MHVSHSGARWPIRIALLALLAVSPVWAHLDLELQIADVTRRIEAEPDNAQLYIQRGELYRIHEDWDAAEKDFLHARKIDPALDLVDYFVGNLQLEAGRPKAARKSLDRFLAAHPGHAKARVARARTLIRLGLPREAALDYTQAIAAYDGDHRPDPSFYIERARALAGLGPEFLDEAVSGLDEGLARLGQPVTLQLYAIELEVARGRHDAALARLEQIASRAARKETWLVRRGEILEQAGRPGEAREAYAAALSAIMELPPGRRANRAMQRLREQAETAIERIAAQDVAAKP